MYFVNPIEMNSNAAFARQNFFSKKSKLVKAMTLAAKLFWTPV